MKKKFLLFALFILSSAFAFAQSPFSAQAVRETQDGQPAIRVSFEFPVGHHLYSSFSVTDAQGRPLRPLRIPKPDTDKPGDLEPSYSAPFSAFYAPPAQGDTVIVSFQGCAGSLCYMPQEATFTLGDDATPDAVQPPRADTGSPMDLLAARGEPRRAVGYQKTAEFLVFLDPDTPPHATGSAWRLFLKDPGEFYLQKGMGLSILLILIGGFLLNLTPCVLPMIPVNLLVYGALGLVVVLSGSVFGSLNASPVFNGLIAILFFVLALAMFDVWQLDLSRFRKSSAIAGRARIPTVLFMGGLAALLAGACVAPVLIAVLALSSTLYAKGISSALFLPFLLGVGMALPWPLAATGLSVLPKPGAWMNRIKKFFGVLILLLAILYAWNTLTALRSSDTSEIPEGIRRVDLQRDPPGTFEALLRDGIASGKPILLDFGAHWCKACHLMDATTLREPHVTDKLNGLFAIQIMADTPNKPPASDLLHPLGIQGFPTYLLYPAP